MNTQFFLSHSPSAFIHSYLLSSLSAEKGLHHSLHCLSPTEQAGRMSDMDDDDSMDYGFEYSEEEEEEEDVDIENQYYNSKGALESAPEEALEGFKGVVRMEAEGAGKGEWGFKALKQVVKIRFRLGQSKEMLADYRCAYIDRMSNCFILACVRPLVADMCVRTSVFRPEKRVHFVIDDDDNNDITSPPPRALTACLCVRMCLRV